MTPVEGGRWAGLLQRIAAEVEPTATGFAVLGERWTDDGGPDGLEKRRHEALTRLLYRRYYQQHDDPAAPTSLVTARMTGARCPAEEDASWGAQLRRRLAGRVVWEHGWSEVGNTLNAIRVAKNDVVVLARTEDTRRRDGALQVRFPANRPLASPGFFLTVGRAGAGTRSGAVVRAYVHLLPTGALDAFAGLVERLDQRRIPFSAKVVDHLDAFDRPDCAVVYSGRDDAAVLVTTALEVRHHHARHIGASVPAFTLPVAPGVAVADEPHAGPRQSFGRQRCGLVAAGLLQAADPSTAAGRLAGVHDALRSAGLDLGRLHLNPGSPDLVLPVDLGGAA